MYVSVNQVQSSGVVSSKDRRRSRTFGRGRLGPHEDPRREMSPKYAHTKYNTKDSLKDQHFYHLASVDKLQYLNNTPIV